MSGSNKRNFMSFSSRKLSQMDQKFIDKAKNELGETELKKSQSLQQFREYIAKYDFLKDFPISEYIFEHFGFRFISICFSRRVSSPNPSHQKVLHE
jgi:hypothetical protein